MNTDGHYTVYPEDSARRWRILSIGCAHCNYGVALSRFKRTQNGARIAAHGRGRYNAARGAIVKHLHAEHRDILAGNPVEAVSRPDRREVAPSA